MKTFKLVALSFVDGEEIEKLPLEDGLIINKEFGGEKWLIEAYLPSETTELFREYEGTNELVHLQATISKPTNDPANFQVTVKSISEMNDHISVLFDAQLFRRTNNFHEKVLKSLLDEGLTGEELVVQFREKVQEKPTLQTQGK
ncbi:MULTISPECIES: YwpF family protein [Bacillus]|uniref:YwpF family protein n=1 Tax=Bacillus TaxID=1386 RepID=UPI000BB8FB43|nr:MULTISPECIES: YwpF family protein [Bacillus]